MKTTWTVLAGTVFGVLCWTWIAFGYNVRPMLYALPMLILLSPAPALVVSIQQARRAEARAAIEGYEAWRSRLGQQILEIPETNPDREVLLGRLAALDSTTDAAELGRLQMDVSQVREA